MPCSSSSIESAIEKLKKSPGVFQRLVERYARLNYPHRFKDLIPLGRNSNDVAVKGWPDAYANSLNGLMDVAESTHSPEWHTHLEQDLAKVESLGNGKLAGFLFAAWANEPSRLTDHQKPNPRYAQLESFRTRLRAVGIPEENITFVFKKQLTDTLSQPRFAAVLKDVLELPCHSRPFKPFNQVKTLFGRKNSLNVFAPSQEEYEQDLVHRTHIIDEVKSSLINRRWAWVCGRGAAGKTVLAIQIAWSYKSNSHPVYYLDLTEEDLRETEALNIIATYADVNVLFIIDNVHLNEDFASEIFNYWLENPQGSHLFLLGRDVSVSYSRGTALPLDDLRENILPLTVGLDDLAGVYRRLVQRTNSPTNDCCNPPHEVLQDWHALFGGDLIAFSAAVVNRREQLLQDEWQLQAKDAEEYISETYLEEASDLEKLNLLRISVLAQLEIAAPSEVIEAKNVKRFLRNGLVHVSKHGQEKKYKRYRLIHPGIGNLLIAASHKANGFTLEQFCLIAVQHPFCGMYIASRLESIGFDQEAISILKHIIELEGWVVETLILPGISYFPQNIERLICLEVLSRSEIDEGIITALEKSENHDTLVKTTFQTPLNFWRTSLTYTKSNLPKTHTAIISALEKSENHDTLVKRTFQTPLNFWRSFLTYTKSNLPKTHTAIVSALEKSENHDTLIKVVLQTQLGNLTSFLTYTKSNLPKTHTAIVSALEKSENHDTLVKRTFQTQLGNLTSFLTYTKSNLPKTHTAIVSALEKSENHKILFEKILCTPLEHLAFFLKYVDKNLSPLSKILDKWLIEPGTIDSLAKISCKSPLDHLLNFLNFLDESLSSKIVLSINKETWDRCRLSGKSEQPTYFHSIAEKFQALKRLELAHAPAHVLIRAAEPQHWHAPGIGLQHISQVMRLVQGAEINSLENFLTRIVTQNWIENQYKTSYKISNCLFSIWGYYDQSILDHFLIDNLPQIVKSYLTNSIVPITIKLQLVGCCALIGVSLDSDIYNQIFESGEVIGEISSQFCREKLGAIQIQLLLGLREIARAGKTINVEPALGRKILERWNNEIEPQTEKHRFLNEWITNWLKQCAENKWMLSSDDGMLLSKSFNQWQGQME
jgi:hypothetical protein